MAKEGKDADLAVLLGEAPEASEAETTGAGEEDATQPTDAEGAEATSEEIEGDDSAQGEEEDALSDDEEGAAEILEGLNLGSPEQMEIQMLKASLNEANTKLAEAEEKVGGVDSLEAIAFVSDELAESLGVDKVVLDAFANKVRAQTIVDTMKLQKKATQKDALSAIDARVTQIKFFAAHPELYPYQNACTQAYERLVNKYPGWTQEKSTGEW